MRSERVSRLGDAIQLFFELQVLLVVVGVQPSRQQSAVDKDTKMPPRRWEFESIQT